MKIQKIHKRGMMRRNVMSLLATGGRHDIKCQGLKCNCVTVTQLYSEWQFLIVFKGAHNTAMCVNVYNNNQVKYTDFSVSHSTTECVSWTEDWPQSWCVHWAACWHSLHSGSRCLWSGGWRKESQSGGKRQKLLLIFYIWDFSFLSVFKSHVMSCALLPSLDCCVPSQTSGWRHGAQCDSCWSYSTGPFGAERGNAGEILVSFQHKIANPLEYMNQWHVHVFSPPVFQTCQCWLYSRFSSVWKQDSCSSQLRDRNVRKYEHEQTGQLQATTNSVCTSLNCLAFA